MTEFEDLKAQFSQLLDLVNRQQKQIDNITDRLTIAEENDSTFAAIFNKIAERARAQKPVTPPEVN